MDTQEKQAGGGTSDIEINGTKYTCAITLDAKSEKINIKVSTVSGEKTEVIYEDLVDKNIIFEGIGLEGKNEKFALVINKDNSDQNKQQCVLKIIDKVKGKPIPGVKFKITDKDGKIKIKLGEIHATDIAEITGIEEKDDAKKLLEYVKENNETASPTDKWKEINKIATEFNEIKDIIADKETKDGMNMDTFLEVKKSMKDQNSNNETPAMFYAKNTIAYHALVLYQSVKALEEFKAIMTNEDYNDAIKEAEESIKESKGKLLNLFNYKENPKITEFANLVFDNFFNIKNVDLSNKDNIAIMKDKGCIYFVEEEIRKQQEKENKIAEKYTKKWKENITLKREQKKNETNNSARI
jgi:hypothetical protein